MIRDQVIGHIVEIMGRTLADKGVSHPKIIESSELLAGDLGFDSLDLALLVRELEDIVGHDPFQDGFIEFKTIGQLADLYAK